MIVQNKVFMIVQCFNVAGKTPGAGWVIIYVDGSEMEYLFSVLAEVVTHQAHMIRKAFNVCLCSHV